MDKDAGTLFVRPLPVHTDALSRAITASSRTRFPLTATPSMSSSATRRTIFPGAVINCRPVGVLVMEDDGGGDEKIIAVPTSKLTQRYDKIQNYSDLPDISMSQIEHFFNHYKDLEPDKWVKIGHWGNADEARQRIVEGIERAKAA